MDTKWKENKRKVEEKRLENLIIEFESGREEHKVIMVGVQEIQTQDEQEAKRNEIKMMTLKFTYENDMI